MPMCGVPHHAVRGYIAKLTELGSQGCDLRAGGGPGLAKGLVKREVVRIVTPGVVLDDDVLDPKLPRYVCALVPSGKARDGRRGRPRVPRRDDRRAARDRAARPGGGRRAGARRAARGARRGARALRGARAPRYRAAWNARAGARGRATRAASFARSRSRARPTRRSRCAPPPRSSRTRARPSRRASCRSRGSRCTGPSDAVVLDEAAIAHLELTETLIGRRRAGSLLDVIDQTVTAPGGRLLRRWLLYPLVDVAQIRRRQDAVAWLVERPALTEQVRRALSRDRRPRAARRQGDARRRDPARPRPAARRARPASRSARAGPLGRERLDPLPALLSDAAVTGDASLAAADDPALAQLAARLGRRARRRPAAPAQGRRRDPHRPRRDGRRVPAARRRRQGGHPRDRRRASSRRSGIANLKVRYNRVFGYYIEITKAHLAKVPAHYVRKQTIAGGERYVTPELAELERKVLDRGGHAPEPRGRAVPRRGRARSPRSRRAVVGRGRGARGARRVRVARRGRGAPRLLPARGRRRARARPSPTAATR